MQVKYQFGIKYAAQFAGRTTVRDAPATGTSTPAAPPRISASTSLHDLQSQPKLSAIAGVGGNRQSETMHVNTKLMQYFGIKVGADTNTHTSTHTLL